MSSPWDDALHQLASAWDDAVDDLLDETGLAPSAATPESHPPAPGQPTGAHTPEAPGLKELQLSSASPHLRCPFRSVFQQVLAELGYPETTNFAQQQEEVAQVASFYAAPGRKLHASKEALATIMNVPAAKLQPHLNLITNCLIHLDRQYRLQIEEMVNQGSLEMVLYMDQVRYDETPMKVKHEVLAGPPLLDTLQGLDAEHRTATTSCPSAPLTLTSSTASIAKMFSTEVKYGMLLRGTISTDDDHVEQKYFFLKGSTLTWNQLLGSGSGSCMARALQETSAVSEKAEEFYWKTRVATTDAAPANILCEKILQGQRTADWSTLHIHCNVHKAARAMTRAFDLTEPDISGLINMSLSLQVGASMHDFRAAMSAVVAHKPLVIHRGTPPNEVLNYQEFILQTFMSTGSRKAERAFLLQEVMTGDWRRSDALEVYLPPATQVDEKQYKQVIEKTLLQTLAHKNLSTFPKHRWLGADNSLDQVGMLFAVHNVGCEAFMLMCHSLQSKKLPALILTQRASAAQAVHQVEHPQASMAVTSGEKSVLPRTLASSSRDFAGQDSSEDEDAGGMDADALAAKNARTRRKAASWLASSPWSHIFIMRKFLKPISSLMTGYIAESGDHFEKQRLLARLGLGPVAVEGKHRDGGILDYIKLVQEKHFQADLADALDTPSWAWLPPTSKLESTEALAFRLSSRLGALVYHLLIFPTQLCPMLTFKLVDSPDLADHLQDLPHCVHDQFTSDFLKKYPGDRIGSSDALMSLRVLGEHTKVETVQLEWGHGRVHRFITSVSTQTHVPQASYINSQWVCQKQSQRQGKWSAPFIQRPSTRKLKRKAQNKPLPKAKQPRGWGGAFRAFLSLHHKGQRGRVDFKTAAAAFREAREHNTEAYQQAVHLGSIATARQQAGHSGFGSQMRAAQKKRTRATQRLVGAMPLAVTALEAVAGNEAGERDTAALVWNPDIPASLAKVRSKERAVQRERVAQDRLHMARLSDYVQDEGLTQVEALTNALPELLPCTSSLCPLPSDELVTLDIVADHMPATVGLAGYATVHSHSSSLSRSLLHDWKIKNRVITETVQQSAAVAPKRGLSSLCSEEGRCLCKGAGLEVRRLRTEVLKQLKTHCPKGAYENRRRLAEGLFVLAFTAESSPKPEPTGWELAMAEREGEESEEEPQQAGLTFWFHVASHYFRPYKPVLQELRFLHKEGEEVVLEQTGDFCELVEVVEKMDLELRWHLNMFVLLERQTPVIEFAPRRCHVQSCSSGPVPVWPLKKRGRPRGPTRADLVAGSDEASAPQPAVDDDLPPETERLGGDGDEQHESESSSSMEQESEVSDEDGQDECEAEASLQGLLAELLEMAPDAEGPQQEAQEEAEHSEAGSDVSKQESEQPQEENAEAADAMCEAEEVVQPGLPASSTAAAPAEPPARPVAAAPKRGRAAPLQVSLREPAELVWYLPFGRITYYRQGFFTCLCLHPNHEKCIMTRTAKAGSRPAQGRPLAFLYTWLQAGENLPDKACHWEPAVWPTFEAREAARNQILDNVEAAPLLAMERARRPGEGPEPEGRP